MAMVLANQQGREEALQELARTLAASIDACDDAKLLPGLARQYRETIRELSEIGVDADDGIEVILDGVEHVR